MLARPELSPEAQADLDLLQGVRDVVDRGWIQGRYCAMRDETMHHCLIGAHFDVTKGWHGSPYEMEREQTSFARLLGLRNGTSVVEFNDLPGRTKEEVLERLDQAIDRRREMG